MVWNFIKKITLLLLITSLFWHNSSFGVNASPATANSIVLAQNTTTTSHDWNEIDQQLYKNLKKARDDIETLAEDELNAWKKELMDRVEKDFFDWYFSFLNQKAMEYGIPVSWLALKLDEYLKDNWNIPGVEVIQMKMIDYGIPFDNFASKIDGYIESLLSKVDENFKVVRDKDEESLDANEVIQKRMVQDFNRKFNELVLNENAEESLKEKINRIGKTYAIAVRTEFSKVKEKYQVSDEDWEKHLGQLANLIYNTGNSQSDLSATALNSKLATKIYAATTAAIGTKLAAKFAERATAKISAKAGASVATQAGAKLLNPILGVGFLVWEVWDYQEMVDQSRPQLRQNISDYLEELKYSILSGEDGILSAISEVEYDLYRKIQSLGRQSSS